jgi:hypothetical protein
MTESYVGIVSRLGLEQLWLEHRHTLQFVLRRVERIKTRPACAIWAVLDPVLEEQIAIQIQFGSPLDALLLLQTVALDLGCIHAESHETIFDAC